MMSEARLRELLDAFPRLRLLVVGDYFLDKYLVMDPSLAETSLETGLAANQVVAKRCSPGAAGTVMSNLAALGIGTLHAVGAIGDDGEGYDLKRGLRERGVHLDYLVESGEVFTPTYTKPMRCEGGTEREMERLDIKNRKPLPAALEARVLDVLRRAVPEVEGVIVADQVQERNFGVVTDGVRAELTRLAARYPEKVFFADSRVRIGEFRGVVVKPNRMEAAEALGVAGAGDLSREELASLGRQLAKRTGQPVILTLSHEGSLVCTAEGVQHVPAFPVEGEIDPVGAGDSTTAGAVAARCAGSTWEEAALVGNLVASVTVQKLGTTGTASPGEVLERLRVVGW